jgi:AbrB family looped-hinge helix DNA binding protein
MEAFKITAKHQVTIPKKVRKILHLKKGDSIEYKIEDKKVVLHKKSKDNNQYLQHLDELLTEWQSDEDKEAYNDL